MVGSGVRKVSREITQQSTGVPITFIHLHVLVQHNHKTALYGVERTWN